MQLMDWLLQLVIGKNFETYVEDETIKKAQKMF